MFSSPLKTIILFITLITTAFNVQAKAELPDACQSYKQEITETSLVIFNKEQLFKLGECLAIDLIKQEKDQELRQACLEVKEDDENIFAIMLLSQVEAIQVGQCLGTINYIRHFYHDKQRSQYYGGYRNTNYGRFSCDKRDAAIKKIINSDNSLNTENQLIELLCN